MNTNNNKSYKPSKFFDEIRKIGIQRQADRWVAGVCSGIAHKLDINVFIIRALFIISPFISFGTTLALYIILWLLLPDATKGGAIILQGSHINSPSNDTYQTGNTTGNNMGAGTTTPIGTPYSHKPQTPKVKKPSRPQVSPTHLWLTFGIISLAIAGTVIVQFITNSLYLSTLFALSTITIIFGLSILIAGIMGKRSTVISVLGTLFTIFITLPLGMTTVAVNHYHNFAPEYSYESFTPQIPNRYREQTTPNTENVTPVVNLNDYATKPANANGEIEVALPSNMTEITINTNGHNLRLALQSMSDNSVDLISNRTWVKATGQSWSEIPRYVTNNGNVVKAGQQANVSNLGVFDYNGQPVTKTYASITNDNEYANGYEYEYVASQIKTSDYDKAEKKFVIHVEANIDDINVVDLQNQWVGYVQEDSTKPKGVAFKYLTVLNENTWSGTAPNENAENFVALTSKDLGISQNQFTNLQANYQSVLNAINKGMGDESELSAIYLSPNNPTRAILNSLFDKITSNLGGNYYENDSYDDGVDLYDTDTPDSPYDS